MSRPKSSKPKERLTLRVVKSCKSWLFANSGERRSIGNVVEDLVSAQQKRELRKKAA